MEIKICTKCNTGFPNTEQYFYKDISCKNGLRPECKKCRYKYEKEYRKNNREKIKSKHKKYESKIMSKNKRKKWNDLYRKNNREFLRKKEKEYYNNYIITIDNILYNINTCKEIEKPIIKTLIALRNKDKFLKEIING